MYDLQWLNDLGMAGAGAGVMTGVFFGSIRTKLKDVVERLTRIEERLNGTVEEVHSVDVRVARLESAAERASGEGR